MMDDHSAVLPNSEDRNRKAGGFRLGTSKHQLFMKMCPRWKSACREQILSLSRGFSGPCLEELIRHTDSNCTPL
jgi:hypothetical protein